MNFSTDEKHRETLQFLGEVRAFLATWPPHPMMHAMLRRIDAHLAAPGHQMQILSETLRRGGIYGRAGEPFMQAELKGDGLQLTLPPKCSTLTHDKEVLRRLYQGEMTMTLKLQS